MTHNPILSVYRDAPAYPPLLATIPDPPEELWVRGRLDLLSADAVAIVGSRAASAYALDMAATLAFDLARRGIVVVSGMARGVDGAAHRAALEAGGATIAVLGCGVDIPYPAEHADLLEKLAQTGAIASELPPGTPPRARHFPLRNRIISGLSRVVVVVEAHERSGSLITARCALEQGRDVCAVPGNALSGRNRGSHALLKDGAKLVEGVDDILEELGLAQQLAVLVDRRNLLRHNGLMLNMQAGETYGLDELGASSGLSASELLPALTELELEGQVVRTPGGRFALASKRV